MISYFAIDIKKILLTLMISYFAIDVYFTLIGSLQWKRNKWSSRNKDQTSGGSDGKENI